MSLRHNQCGWDALTFEQCIGSERGTVVQSAESAIEAWFFCFDDGADFVDAVLDADALVVGRGGDFGSEDMAGGEEGAGVDKGASDVDGEAVGVYRCGVCHAGWVVFM
ncbi:hypothetical protein Tdes44962_MAKER08704 [Teratosphaeria destructans]|uniref:Uncharacterized protein n=1 Tax=Teratosphaeria destructans TaxID=418781 RepID=A0A9W7SVX1_9PEZI|nr:hypothetical protein Tdes44962_MAKER08704 [Teratosphaeria destructans]